jgi:hypothetical protein
MSMQRRYCVLMQTTGGVAAVIPDGLETCLALPRLTALEQTEPWVLGAFDLRGELVPVISIEMLCGGGAPPAAASDLVVVAAAGGFPMGLHASRPVCIETLAPTPVAARARRCIHLNRLCLTAATGAGAAEARLARFERQLSQQALRRLELRAHHYGDFTGLRRPPAPAAAPGRW